MKNKLKKKAKRKVQGVPQSQTKALPRHQEEEETNKSKQAEIITPLNECKWKKKG